jgi:hypothetical protein
VGQDEYTSQRCQRSVATHLTNIIVNADVPLNFRLTALLSTLVDRGKSINDLMALSCEIDFSGPKLRISCAPKNPSQIYVLVSRSTKSVISRLHTDWQSTVRAVTPAEKLPSIDQNVARHWFTCSRNCTSRSGYFMMPRTSITEGGRTVCAQSTYVGNAKWQYESDRDCCSWKLPLCFLEMIPRGRSGVP